jgi:cyclopentanol dehydrogenase
VIVADIQDGSSTTTAIEDAGGSALSVTLDVTQKESWQNAIRVAEEAFGPISVLVNNAGLHGGRSRFEAMDLDVWGPVMDVNAFGTYLGMASVLPSMKRAGGGSIVNISSISAMVAMEYPDPDTTPVPVYHASKAAVTILSKYAAAQFGRFNVRVNSLHPGPITTTMGAASVEDPVRRKHFMDVIPLGRFGSADDIAKGALYLASDDSSFVTGSQLVIDGGYTCRA